MTSLDIQVAIRNQQYLRSNIKAKADIGTECVWENRTHKSTRNHFWNKEHAKRQPCVVVYSANQ